jgi:hypothetical protein
MWRRRASKCLRQNRIEAAPGRLDGKKCGETQDAHKTEHKTSDDGQPIEATSLMCSWRYHDRKYSPGFASIASIIPVGTTLPFENKHLARITTMLLYKIPVVRAEDCRRSTPRDEPLDQSTGTVLFLSATWLLTTCYLRPTNRDRIEV